MPDSLCNAERKQDCLDSWCRSLRSCPGFDRWTLRRSGCVLPGPASSSQCRHLGVVPREGWDPHPHPASAGLLGSLTYREEPQISGRKKKKENAFLWCGNSVVRHCGRGSHIHVGFLIWICCSYCFLSIFSPSALLVTQGTSQVSATPLHL